MNDLLNALGLLGFARAVGRLLVPAIIIAGFIEYWRPILIYGGGAFAVCLMLAGIMQHRDRKQTERWYAAERERLAKLGLDQKMKPLTLR